MKDKVAIFILLLMVLPSKCTSESYGKYGTSTPSDIAPIDALPFSRYLGGLEDDRGADIVVDSNGDIYGLVYTDSDNLPEANTIMPYSGLSDIYIFKLSSDYRSIIYGSYIGGSGIDYATNMIIDSNDNLYVIGETRSTDFPVTVNAWDTTHNGNYDAFIFKINTVQNEIEFCTLFGGSEYDRAWGITLDSNQNVIVVGQTLSSDLPIHNGWDTNLSGNSDNYVVKLDTTGSDILFSSYLGGSDEEEYDRVDVDSIDNIYISGTTRSDDLLESLNCEEQDCFDESLDGRKDGYFMTISPTGIPQYASFLGGAGSDSCTDIVIDEFGYVFLSGLTSSVDFPTVNPCQQYSGGADCFVARIDLERNSLLFSSFLGGGGEETEPTILLDNQGNCYVYGSTASTNFPTINALFDSYNGGLSDIFLSKINVDSSSILYSTYYGGSGFDVIGFGLAYAFGNLFLIGSTDSHDIVTHNVQGTEGIAYRGGSYDCYIFGIRDVSDYDGDDLLEYQEIEEGTDPFDNDTDNDGMLDGWEVLFNLDPLDSNDANIDADYDGLSNLEEHNLNTFPNRTDTDFDGFPDGWEFFNGYDPNNPEVPFIEIVAYNMPVIVVAIGTVVVLVIFRFIRPRLKQKEEEERARIIDEEEKKALEELIENND